VHEDNVTVVVIINFSKKKKTVGLARVGGEKQNISLYGDKDNPSLCKPGDRTSSHLFRYLLD